ncbi:CCHC-type domain-containing protein [Trichonephila clavipes]|nr:CCHC-type domain-containing protein [Trichonephila clavipes]
MAKSRSGRSKKRRFTGNRYTIRATINENDETSELNSTESTSAKKLESSHTSLEIFSERLFPYDREDERFLSYKLFNCFGAKDNRERIFNWQKLCAFLGLPFLSKLAFRNQERKLLKAQENINAALSEIKGSNSFTKCGISIDGTWQRRGYSSLNGCVSAISVDTGKILDIEVMTQYCHICAKGNSQSSKQVCSNYKGSAGNMEVVGAYRIFERSNVRNVQYNEYYGDGDSKGYESVKNFYGINTVTKLECIGHVQKRVGGGCVN